MEFSWTAIQQLERERIKALEREVHELRQAKEILRKASAYFGVTALDRRCGRRWSTPAASAAPGAARSYGHRIEPVRSQQSRLASAISIGTRHREVRHRGR